MNVKFIFLFVTSLFGGSLASAYSVSTHKLITARAVEEYNICSQTFGRRQLPPGAAEILAKANVFEDLAIWVKALNWHFYQLSEDLGQGFLSMGKASFNKRFAEIERDLEKSPSLAKLGGLLHYVQDLTNPAHVAPVFHVIGDSFDNYDFANKLPSLISENACRDLALQSRGYRSYGEILSEVRLQTLSRMAESFVAKRDGQSVALRWRDAFWNPDFGKGSLRKGFGHYGELGNNFGETRIGSFEIGQVVYSDFARRQIRYALDASILFIEAFQVGLDYRTDPIGGLKER